MPKGIKWGQSSEEIKSFDDGGGESTRPQNSFIDGIVDRQSVRKNTQLQNFDTWLKRGDRGSLVSDA